MVHPSISAPSNGPEFTARAVRDWLGRIGEFSYLQSLQENSHPQWPGSRGEGRARRGAEVWHGPTPFRTYANPMTYRAVWAAVRRHRDGPQYGRRARRIRATQVAKHELTVDGRV